MAEHGISKVIGTSVETTVAKGATATGILAGPFAYMTEYMNLAAVFASALLAVATAYYWICKNRREAKRFDLEQEHLRQRMEIEKSQAFNEQKRKDDLLEYYTHGDRRKVDLEPDEVLDILDKHKKCDS